MQKEEKSLQFLVSHVLRSFNLQLNRTILLQHYPIIYLNRYQFEFIKRYERKLLKQAKGYNRIYGLVKWMTNLFSPSPIYLTCLSLRWSSSSLTLLLIFHKAFNICFVDFDCSFLCFLYAIGLVRLSRFMYEIGYKVLYFVWWIHDWIEDVGLNVWFRDDLNFNISRYIILCILQTLYTLNFMYNIESRYDQLIENAHP